MRKLKLKLNGPSENWEMKFTMGRSKVPAVDEEIDWRTDSQEQMVEANLKLYMVENYHFVFCLGFCLGLTFRQILAIGKTWKLKRLRYFVRHRFIMANGFQELCAMRNERVLLSPSTQNHEVSSIKASSISGKYSPCPLCTVHHQLIKERVCLVFQKCFRST